MHYCNLYLQKRVFERPVLFRNELRAIDDKNNLPVNVSLEESEKPFSPS